MARKKKRRGEFDAQAVLRIFKQAKRPLSRGEIMRALGLPKHHRDEVRQVLNDLVRQGRIIRLKRGAYGLTEGMSQVSGKLEVQRSGVGFVLCDDKRRSDIFVSPDNFGDARHGDRVVVAVLPVRTGKRSEGRIVRVLERGAESLAARAVKRVGSHWLFLPTDPRQDYQLMVEAKGLSMDQVALVRVGEKLERDLWAGELLETLGAEDDVDVQEALVKINHSVPIEFPESVLRQAEALPKEPSPEEYGERQDLRHMGFVTIDGARAKDFDDAIYVEPEDDGFRLWVAIADVSHYVPPGSALDREARERGNSYYFPRSVEPMFPEALSNGLCSLNPKVDRMVMVAEIPFTRDGMPGEPAIYPGVIHSHARLTYAQVNRALLQGDREERENIAGVLPMLEQAEKLARQIHQRRTERGSLDFDLPEPEILFNFYGETEEVADIRPKVRHFGHQIIEEFMIAANEAVAEFLSTRGFPCLFRVHPPPDPDKVEALFRLLIRTDLAEDVPEAATPRALQDLLHAAQDTDLEYMVNRLTLRTMMQASYSPKNTGHFGLASPLYCHFTSPIRRYADLVVHRSIKAALAQGPVERPKGLKKIADHLSETERKAMEAEREILKRITALFLRDKIGHKFTGVVNSMADFGFWVELREVMAEGLVRLSSLTDDYYALFPERQEIIGQRTGRRFKLGQVVGVELEEVNLSRLEINLLLLDELPGASRDSE
ncbi:MAG: ribonuclease R [Desulfovibrio sp.]|nr:MAG: ribonuclease R [Desulfovibrio sp.]